MERAKMKSLTDGAEACQLLPVAVAASGTTSFSVAVHFAGRVLQ